MDKRVCVHNTHIVDHTSIPLTVGMRVMYMEQVDSVGRKVAVNCRLFNDECIGKGLRTSKRDRSRSKCRIRRIKQAFKLAKTRYVASVTYVLFICKGTTKASVRN